ncbi:MAG TPA: nucleotidyltransferase family protein [Leptospiraceae bacterium]|nr:nucleotidyltransferase family protein [Leptospiraceae bacterium]
MRSWEQSILAPERSILDALKQIDATGIQLVLVAGPAGKLEGVLTDGDIRRAILKGQSLDIAARDVMNSNPVTVRPDTSHEEMLSIMRRGVLHHLPVVDADRRIVGLATLDDLIGAVEKPNRVVLMAGGQGKRLRPLTEDTPKPLLAVGGKPILENILENFAEQGFRRFYASVNYLAHTISDYFGDGTKWGVKIEYLHEKQSLGTAGALSLLPEVPEEPILVMNGDLLTRANFSAMLKFHEENKAAATMAVKEYDFQVPYGVVRIEGHEIRGIEEKPVHKFFVNAGIYTISPAALKLIPSGQFFDMPTLFDKLRTAGQSTSAYPLREYWLDIGGLEDFRRANGEFGETFS